MKKFPNPKNFLGKIWEPAESKDLFSICLQFVA